MKFPYFKLLAVSFSLFLVSCENVDWKKLFPRNTFETAFPKKNKDLTKIFGTHLILKRDNDTLRLKIGMKDDLNLVIMEKEGDTMFYGTVSKYRGLYYFSQKINDTSFWIFAVKRSGSLLYGINGMMAEEMKMDEAALSGKYPGLVKYINKDTSLIRLHTDKKMLRNILEPYIDSLKPFTILNIEEIEQENDKDTADVISPVDSEEFKLIANVYPNPATSIVNIQLREPEKTLFKFSDMSGKILKNGELSSETNPINIEELSPGLYILTVSATDGKTSESVKVLKR